MVCMVLVAIVIIVVWRGAQMCFHVLNAGSSEPQQMTIEREHFSDTYGDNAYIVAAGISDFCAPHRSYIFGVIASYL